jgi:hypothetical protein
MIAEQTGSGHLPDPAVSGRERLYTPGAAALIHVKNFPAGFTSKETKNDDPGARRSDHA